MNKNLDYAQLWQQVEGLPWCALVTTGRTGTDFFQSLLDSHPEAFVFNGQFYFHDFWAASKAANVDGPLSTNDIADELINANQKKFRSHLDTVERKDKLGEGRNQSINIDTGEFRGHLLGLLKDRVPTSRSFLIATYVAYALCLGQDPSTKILFFHHQHRIGRLRPFLNDFPESKIICMTRDPRALYVSGVENWRRNNSAADSPHFPLYILWRAVDEILPLKKYTDGRLRVLKLEDLSDEKTLLDICQWLGISFDPCMKESTWGGMRWWGDEISQNQIPETERGFSKTMATNQWEQKLGALDKTVLNYLLADVLEWYGYPHTRSDGFIMACFMALAILVPTGYERRYLSPRYLGKSLVQGNIRQFIAVFYHPVRRVVQFYKWFFRRNFGHFFIPPYFRQGGA